MNEIEKSLPLKSLHPSRQKWTLNHARNLKRVFCVSLKWDEVEQQRGSECPSLGTVGRDLWADILLVREGLTEKVKFEQS